MILVFHGARKNVGDFLIHQRGLQLLRSVHPEQELVSVPRFEPIDPTILDGADAAVICGGPGLVHDFSPRVFSLDPDVAGRSTAISAIAMGWRAALHSDPSAYVLSDSSRSALATIGESGAGLGVRDDLSLEVLKANAIESGVRTGCTSWFHLPSIGRSPVAGREVRLLVVTGPSDVRLYPQALRLLRHLRKRFANARRVLVFHRGLAADRFTTRFESYSSRSLARAASLSGYEIVDAAFDLDSIGFYEEADLHVGYRVHAHLCFLSYRRPSLLIAEDARGVGQAEVLHDHYGLTADRRDLVARTLDAVDEELSGGLPATRAAVEEIERTWPVMRASLAAVGTRR